VAVVGVWAGAEGAEEGVGGSLADRVDLPDAQAARGFAFQEPFDRAGVYGQVLVRRWRNLLGRTMWDYPAEPGDERRFLVIGRAGRGGGGPPVAGGGAAALVRRARPPRRGHRGWALAGGRRRRVGVGSALLVQLGDRAAVAAMLAGAPYVQAGLYASVEVHDWQFGGRHQD
jgi:uncharacterized protein